MDNETTPKEAANRAKALLLAMAAIGALLVAAYYPSSAEAGTNLDNLRSKFGQKTEWTVDHSKFAVLKTAFAKPQDVTAACVSCHNERHKEVMKSSHWNWASVEYVPGRGLRSLGKRNILNNFCIGVESNEQSCAKCHIGYGYNDAGFDFKNPLNVDCLACHDGSDTYVKASGEGGLPEKTVNLPFSGHYGFIRSEMSWPINHMVSTKDKTVSCGECHTRTDGRLAKLGGFYMPGRDRSDTADLLGKAMMLATLLGVAVHGGSRIIAGRRNRRNA